MIHFDCWADLLSIAMHLTVEHFTEVFDFVMSGFFCLQWLCADLLTCLKKKMSYLMTFMTVVRSLAGCELSFFRLNCFPNGNFML